MDRAKRIVAAGGGWSIQCYLDMLRRCAVPKPERLDAVRGGRRALEIGVQPPRAALRWLVNRGAPHFVEK